MNANPFEGIVIQASGTEPIPIGAYNAVFSSVEAFSNEKASDKFRWRWDVVSGPHSGRNATALTDRKLTPKTHGGRLLTGLLNRQLIPGENVSELWQALQECIGKRYLVSVQPGPNGGKPSVQMVSLPPEM